MISTNRKWQFHHMDHIYCLLAILYNLLAFIQNLIREVIKLGLEINFRDATQSAMQSTQGEEEP